MVSPSHRLTKAAAALGVVAAASLCGRHAADALSSTVTNSNHIAFAPPHGQPWLARSRASLQSRAHSHSHSSTTGCGRRRYVRDRSGFESSEGGRAAVPFLSPGWGSRRGTQLSAAEDAGETSSSAIMAGDGTVAPFMPAILQDALPKEWQVKLSNINRDPAKLAFVMNVTVIFLFAAFAAFKLATVDGDIARGWTWYEVLLRVPGDNFYRYEETVSESPVVTKAFTSCIAYGLGDFTAQLFTGKDLETIDLKRTARSATAGLLVHGPFCHYWIEFMQTYLDFDGAWWNFVPKVIADQTVYSVFLNAAYSTMIMGLQGKSKEEVWSQVKTTAWPALSSSWRFWPLIHCCSFSNAIPKDLKLLFIDCMEIIWVTILSTVANGDRKADSAEVEMVPALANGSALPNEEEGGVGAAPAVVMKAGEVETEKSEVIRR